ncbi:MAG: hypothetical protein IJW47_02600 [Clostridia bacterium]|nr:hypothetical protein [Clostridia bacterium]
MKKSIKFLCLFLALFTFFTVGCQKENPLYSAVSELRSDIFVGESQNFVIKACYGFKETPYSNDATVGNKVYGLIFKMSGADGASYSLSTEFGGETFSADFKLNPVSGTLTASMEIENFNLKEFTVTVKKAELSENVTMVSVVPANAIDYKKALDYLKADQTTMIDAYTDKETGEFTAEIYARIVVKDGNPFWYIGIASGNSNLKALLIDGVTGETLAIREIF